MISKILAGNKPRYRVVHGHWCEIGVYRYVFALVCYDYLWMVSQETGNSDCLWGRELGGWSGNGKDTYSVHSFTTV